MADLSGKHITPSGDERELTDLDAFLIRARTYRALPDVAALTDVIDEMARARIAFGPYASPHEGWAVILEELQELWDEVKDNKRPESERKPAMRAEAMQVAATAILFMMECCE